MLSLLASHAPGAQSSLMLGEVRKTPRWSATPTLPQLRLAEDRPSMRPMRIRSPEAVSNPPMLVDDETVARRASSSTSSAGKQEQERDE